MTASIYAEPVDRKKDYIPIAAPSSFLAAMEKVFHQRFPVLDADDIPKLQVLFAMGNFEEEALERLTALIESHGPIQLSAEY